MEVSRAEPVTGLTRLRFSWPNVVKTLIGVILLVALVYFGRIDFASLGELVKSPGAILVGAGLSFLSVPIGAWRWAVLLHAFGVPLPFRRVFHYFALTTVLNLFMFGTVAGDSLRTIMAWRSLGRGGSKVAISVLGDRVAGLAALLVLALVALVLNWRWVQTVPPLVALAAGLAMATSGLLGALVAFAAAPGIMKRLAKALRRWPKLAGVLRQVQEVALAIRAQPGALLLVFCAALAIHLLTVAAVVVIAWAMDVGRLTVTDYLLAVPTALVASAVPVTPNGLGIAETAFDQICRWLEGSPTGAAYSSIFFAFRAVSMLGVLFSLVTFALPLDDDVAEPGAAAPSPKSE